MDELSQQIGQILSDPQSMKQIQEMMGSLGLGNNTPAPSPPAQNNPSDASALLAALNPPPAPQNETPLGALGGLGGLNPQALTAVAKLAPLLQQTQQEDDSTRLLRALRPLLGSSRQQKLDEAVKILQMMRLLPLLRESGLFSGLLSGLL